MVGLSIDNNLSERTLRHQAIGRKNYLFLGSEAAGPRAAVLYTILAGAKRHHIEPWSYLRDIVLRIHAEDLRLEEMLPDRWAAAHPEAILNHRLEELAPKRSAPAPAEHIAVPAASDTWSAQRLPPLRSRRTSSSRIPPCAPSLGHRS